MDRSEQPILSYDPPYESPLEDAFAWALSKYLQSGAKLEKQVEVDTICGRFRLDFVATTQAGRRIAYECDGAEFHDVQRDEWRDAMILGAEHVDAIVRLRGSDLTHHLDDVLWLLANWDPDVFSNRSQTVLHRLASVDARSHKHDSFGMAMLTYRDEPSRSVSPLFLLMLRRNRVLVDAKREFWQAAYRFAKSLGGGNLDDVIAQRGQCRF